MRHPNILLFQDGVDSDKAVFIVSERVQPLSSYLEESKDNESQKENEISWGLYQIAVSFFHTVFFIGVMTSPGLEYIYLAQLSRQLAFASKQ